MMRSIDREYSDEDDEDSPGRLGARQRADCVQTRWRRSFRQAGTEYV